MLEAVAGLRAEYRAELEREQQQSAQEQLDQWLCPPETDRDAPGQVYTDHLHALQGMMQDLRDQQARTQQTLERLLNVLGGER